MSKYWEFTRDVQRQLLMWPTKLRLIAPHITVTVLSIKTKSSFLSFSTYVFLCFKTIVTVKAVLAKPYRIYASYLHYDAAQLSYGCISSMRASYYWHQVIQHINRCISLLPTFLSVYKSYVFHQNRLFSHNTNKLSSHEPNIELIITKYICSFFLVTIHLITVLRVVSWLFCSGKFVMPCRSSESEFNPHIHIYQLR